MNVFLPRRHISPLPSASGFAIDIWRPERHVPAYFKASVELKDLKADGLVRVCGPASSLIPYTF